jgi:hypothetical protein
MKAAAPQGKSFSTDGIIEGFVIHQETLDQLDSVLKAVATNLIRQRRWVLVL